jgi:type I restriction enzyme R subunit
LTGEPPAEQLAALRDEVARAKAANETRPDMHDDTEAQTRDLLIDVLLKEAGWSLDRPEDREFPVTGMPNQSGQGNVDYTLWDDNGKPLGLVEAKRTSRDPRQGQQQAKLYADCLEQAYGSSSTQTATRSGCGTTRTTRPGRCRDSSPVKSCG